MTPVELPWLRQAVHLLRFEFARAKWMLWGYALMLVAVMVVIVLFPERLEPFYPFGYD